MKKTKSGISLIVLVITILVLAILAATVIITISNTNVINQANQTTFKSDMVSYKEAYELYITNMLAEDSSFDRTTLNLIYNDENADTFNEIFGEVSEKYQSGLKVLDGKLVYETEDETEKAIADSLGMASSTTNTPSNVISKPASTEINNTSPYIGYYADIDGDGTVDGVIFADLAYSSSGTWSTTSSSTYSYEAVATSELKDYEISQESYIAKRWGTELGYGDKPVIKAVNETSGKDRFYCMALADITSTKTTNNYFTWYDAAYDTEIDNTDSKVTAKTFGSGKQNTINMISAWNKKTYGAQNGKSGYLDMWGVIQQKAYGKNYTYTEGENPKTEDDVTWFVPSFQEWVAFACYLKAKDTDALTTSNYSSKFGLKGTYWSSSLSGNDSGAYNVWFAYFLNGEMGLNYVGSDESVRLAATF